jgi:hypothetical protein
MYQLDKMTYETAVNNRFIVLSLLTSFINLHTIPKSIESRMRTYEDIVYTISSDITFSAYRSLWRGISSDDIYKVTNDIYKSLRSNISAFLFPRNM